MKYNSKLTKRYYFPIVEGSNYGTFSKDNKTYNAFTTYIMGLRGLIKVTNYSQVWHWFGNRAIEFRKGYYVGWETQGAEMLSTLNKANKYLNRQYCRMEKLLEKKDYKGYTRLYDLISKRSALFRWVIIVRKLPFKETNVLRVLNLYNYVGKLLSKNSTNVKFKRVFLPEFDSKGKLKKYRPLGVPTAEWRAKGAMEEFYLVNLLSGWWSKNQFACMPKRGVADAWIEILKRYVKGVSEIKGYDLAKFFDTVFFEELERFGQLPPKKRKYFIEMNKSKANIRPQDLEKEKLRISDTLKEVTKVLPDNLTEMHVLKEAMQGWYIPSSSMDKLRGLPQGLNTSPILACALLQRTYFLRDHPEIIQYMDDGIVMSNEKIDLREIELDLDIKYSGLAFSAKKSETIMINGEWVKPLKFLGCEFDGDTFRAHTRTKGVYTVRDASKRIEEILKWLEQNRGEIGAYRKKVTSLMADGWNRTDVKTTWWGLAKSGRPEFEIVNQFSTWWEETRAKVERLPWNSVEAMAYRSLSNLGRVWESSNTQSMLCSYYLLSLRGEERRVKGEARANRANQELRVWKEEQNRLFNDW